MLELDCRLQFIPEFDTDFFNSMPSRPGVLLLEMRDAKAKPYLARTADIRRASERLLVAPEAPSKRLNLRDVVAGIHYRVTGSKFEQTLTVYAQAQRYFPERYGGLLRLRPSALLKVNLRNEYPRGYVTRRIRADGGFYFGPFASRRAAEGFSASVLETLETAGSFLIREIQTQREAASEALDFEKAAALHKRLEKVSGTFRGWGELTRRIDEIDAVILQRAAEEKTIVVFPVRAGVLAEPLFLRFAELSSEPKSVEGILRAVLDPQTDVRRHKSDHSKTSAAAGIDPIVQLENVNASPDSHANETTPSPVHRSRYGLRSAPPELTEHLSLLSRWFYSKPREGEILFREGNWPYRRILRACNRLLVPPQTPAQETKPGPQPPP